MIRVSAPGKAILMGEHAAVYGRPALVAAIDRRMHLELEVLDKAADGPSVEGSEPGLTFSLPQVVVEDTWTWRRVVDYAEGRRQAWRRWSEDPESFPFQRVLGTDPAHLVRVAVGETLLHLGELPHQSARLTMHSEIPLGSGFGSSAAASSVAVQAVLEMMGVGGDGGPDRDLVGRLALEAERRQHGAPSGVDTATVIHGGALWVEKLDGRLLTIPVELMNAEVMDRFRVFHSGAPDQATGEVVAAVRALRDRDPTSFDAALDQASTLTVRLRELLEKPCSSAMGRAQSLVRSFGAWLESIGVVPDEMTRVFRAVERAGGAAKVSGAGALEGPGAGSVLIFHPEPEKLDRLAELESLERLDLKLGAPGLRVESRLRP